MFDACRLPLHNKQAVGGRPPRYAPVQAFKWWHDIRYVRIWIGRHYFISILACQYNQPKRPGDLDLWPFDLESGARATCDVGYLCATFSLPRPRCSRVTPDVCDRQTDRQTSDVRQKHLLMPPPIRGGDITSTYIYLSDSVISANDVRVFFEETKNEDQPGRRLPHPQPSGCCTPLQDRAFKVYFDWLIAQIYLFQSIPQFQSLLLLSPCHRCTCTLLKVQKKQRNMTPECATGETDLTDFLPCCDLNFWFSTPHRVLWPRPNSAKLDLLSCGYIRSKYSTTSQEQNSIKSIIMDNQSPQLCTGFLLAHGNR